MVKNLVSKRYVSFYAATCIVFCCTNSGGRGCRINFFSVCVKISDALSILVKCISSSWNSADCDSLFPLLLPQVIHNLLL